MIVINICNIYKNMNALTKITEGDMHMKLYVLVTT
jgi:hypothetical protein